MKQETLKQIHKRNAKALSAIENKLNNLDLKKNDFLYLYEKLIIVKSMCDELIGHTNPEIKDNTKWYYGKFRRKQ